MTSISYLFKSLALLVNITFKASYVFSNLVLHDCLNMRFFKINEEIFCLTNGVNNKRQFVDDD